MNEPVNIIGEYYSLSVPKEGMTFTLYGGVKAEEVRFITMPQPGKFKSHKIIIPADDWSIVSTSDEMTEENAAKIVEGYIYSGRISFQAYKNYLAEKPKSMEDIISDPVESFQSLLKSHGLEGRQLIIRKN